MENEEMRDASISEVRSIWLFRTKPYKLYKHEKQRTKKNNHKLLI